MCDTRPMNQKDKALLRSHVAVVATVANALRQAEADTRKDRELAGFYRRMAEDLEFINADTLDTIERL